jgi:NAD(P)-dependent dehydrogenase (short-subunit alcohol dehydrogenase family)
MTSNGSRDERPLSGQVAVVTGGGRGIGRAVAQGLAAQGAAVAVIARSENELAESVRLIEATGGQGLVVPADVTDVQSVTHVMQAVEQQLGPIDLLVNNAGIITPLGPAWEVEPAEWRRAMEVNVYGPYLCAAAVLRGMIGRRRGRIVNMASTAGLQAIAYASAYVVSKTALIRLAESLAAETKEHGISVFAIHPGTVHTPMNDYLTESQPGRTWVPWFRSRFVEAGTYDAMEPVVELVNFLATGTADALSGCFFGVSEDLADLKQRAEAIQAKSLYTLRLREADDR